STHALPMGSRKLDRVRLRLRVARQQIKLDSALAGGADPDADAALAQRAHQVTGLSTRQAIANAIGHILDAAEEPRESWGQDGSRPPLQRDDILAARELLLALAARLRQPDYMPPRPAALAALLVWDSASPMYAPGTSTTVA